MNRDIEKLPSTIEDLAAMINAAMINMHMASKEDIKEFRAEVNQKFEAVELRLDTLDAQVGRIEADVHALRDETVHRQEFEDALDRIKNIEKKLGIESGVQ